MVRQRATFLFALVLSLGLLILGKIDARFNPEVQRLVVDIATPAAAIVATPVGWAKDAVDGVRDLALSADEAAALRQENEQLRMLGPANRQLSSENARLRAMFALPPITDNPGIMARSVTHPGSPFLWTVLLDAGKQQDVALYQPVIDHAGVVGRILNVGETSSRALLITDMNSRVPVMVEETGDRAILEGDNSRTPVLAFLESAHQVKPGNRVVTSGDGGVFPPLLPIGVVTSSSTGELRVTLHADLSRLEYVQILAYDPALPPDQEKPEPAPTVEPSE
jgi:rod shape-determining protein MreC